MAKFLIPFTESSHAGHYLCLYHKPPSWSEESDTLELVVTVLQTGLYQAKFSLRNVTFVYGGTYKCYSSEDLFPYVLSQPSNPVELVVSEFSANLDSSPQELIPASVGKYDGGKYYCYYETTLGWSAHSDELELVVTGIFDNKPCLSVLPRPVVTSGENVTLKCFSQEEYDRFIVTKEGEQTDPMIMESQKTSAGQFQALFSLGPVTPRSSGTFKCYGYYKANPYVWSEPSDHLEIQVSASENQDHTVENLIRLGIAGLVLIILGVLLLEAWQARNGPTVRLGSNQKRKKNVVQGPRV
ncbi:leukocyte immunoglobulin-like receptor subfamily A member 5 [Cricetulus griseus]|uniref:leukocyte immunoglobulin-like receptor subfamily A member 5 n=1 Tax=Cricetulus griseus TaxID=10029 RepID=UPI0015C32216|nr:leukocyte immunoglobulin-like receptor subfamily A member 5 [Cricetulus griseus]